MEFGDALRLLASANRRRLLSRLLSTSDGRVDVDAALSSGSLRADREVVRLYHVDLPMLADAEVIEWERDATDVERGPAFGSVASLLELVREHGEALPDGWTEATDGPGPGPERGPGRP